MASVNDGEGRRTPPVRPGPISALPSVRARALAFAAIAMAGVFGGLIGFSTVRVGCHRRCSTPEGLGGLVGAIMAATGVAVIAVLVLRAMGEWRTIKEDRAAEMMTAAASAFRQPQSTPPAEPGSAGPDVIGDGEPGGPAAATPEDQ